MGGQNKMKTQRNNKMRRPLALIISVLMLVMLLPSGTIAANPPGEGTVPVPGIFGIANTEGKTDNPSALKDGQIWVNKNVEVEGNGDGTFKVTLYIWGAGYTDDDGNAQKPLDPENPNVTITDRIGAWFSYDNNVTSGAGQFNVENGIATWTVSQDDILNGMQSRSFTVTLKEGWVVETPYETNAGASAAFKPLKGNPYYWTTEELKTVTLVIDGVNWNNGNGTVHGINTMRIADDGVRPDSPKYVMHKLSPSNDSFAVTKNGVSMGNFAFDSAHTVNDFTPTNYKDYVIENSDKSKTLIAVPEALYGAADKTWGVLWDKGGDKNKTYFVWFMGLEGDGVLTVYDVNPGGNGGNNGEGGSRYTFYKEYTRKEGFNWQADDSILHNLPNKGIIEMSYEAREVTIRINKEVTGDEFSGSRPTFTFKLFDNAECAEGTEIATATIANGAALSAAFTIPDIGKYFTASGTQTAKFWIKEIAGPAFANGGKWTYDSATYTVEVDKDGNMIGSTVPTFNNSFEKIGAITIVKNWSDNTPPDEKKDVGYVLYMVVPGAAEDEIITSGTLSGPAWSATVNKLEINKTYYVVEDTSLLNPNDFDAPSVSDEVFLDSAMAAATLKIDNTYNDPKGSVTVSKTWIHDGNPDDENQMPNEIDVTLFKAGNDGDEQVGTKRIVGNSSVVFTGLELDATYYVRETAVDGHDISDYALTVSAENGVYLAKDFDGRNSAISLTNTFIPRVYKLTIIKDWDPVDSLAIPGSVDIEIYKDGEYYDTITLTSPEWTKTITVNGPGVYSINEVGVDEYFTVSYDVDSVDLNKGNREDTLQLTNTDDDPLGTIRVRKVWAGDAYAPMMYTPVTVELYKDGEPTGETRELSSDNRWRACFTDLELGAEYRVVETDSPDGFEVFYSSEGITLERNGRHIGSIEVTNAYGEGIIVLNKIWDHGSNVNESDFNSVQAVVHLYKVDEREGEDYEGDELIGTAIFDNEGNVVNGSNNVFTGLDIDATYYVVEDYIEYYRDAVDNEYITLGGQVLSGVFNVTNTYREPRGEITVTKAWEGNMDPNRPGEIEVGLFHGRYMVDSITLKANEGWTGTFTNVRINRSYTIRELTDLGIDYTVSYTGRNISLTKSAQSASATITNTYTTPTGELDVYKAWNPEAASEEEQRPDTVLIQLQRRVHGGMTRNVGEPVEISADSNWSYHFDNLPLYNTRGATYYYSVVELYVKGYDVSYSGNRAALEAGNQDGAAAQITVTNRFQRHTGSITVNKEWADGVDEEFRTQVTVALFKDGSFVRGSARRLNSDNEWSATWNRLELGAVYTVIELSASEEWEATYNYSVDDGIILNREDNAKSVTVTNIPIEVNAKIDVDKNVTNERAPVIANGRAYINYEVAVTNSGNRTLTDVIITDAFINTPEGSAKVYIVDSELYDFDEDSGVFKIGTMAPGASVTIRYSVEIDQKGLYVNEATADGVYREVHYKDSDMARENVLRPDLALRKEVIGPASRTLNGSSVTFSYKLTIANNGDVDVMISDLTDVMDGPGSIVYDVITEGVSYDAETNSFYFDAGYFENGLIIEAGKSFEVNYNVTVNAAGEYTNDAEVIGWTLPDEIRLHDDDSAKVTVDRPNIPIDPQYGTLVVEKVFNGITNVPDDWSATLTVTGGPDNISETRTITSANRSFTFSGLRAGSYTVTETNAQGIPNYTFTGVDITNNGICAVSANRTTNVTITNAYEETRIPQQPEPPAEELAIEEIETPLGEFEPEEEIEEVAPPLSDMPQTGIEDTIGMWIFALCIAVLGAGALTVVVTRMNKKED